MWIKNIMGIKKNPIAAGVVGLVFGTVLGVLIDRYINKCDCGKEIVPAAGGMSRSGDGQNVPPSFFYNFIEQLNIGDNEAKFIKNKKVDLDQDYNKDAPDYYNAKLQADDILNAFTKIEAARNNVVKNDSSNVNAFDNAVFKTLGVINKEDFDNFKRNIKNIQEKCQSNTEGVTTGFDGFIEE